MNDTQARMARAALQLAIERIGGVVQVARKLGITHAAVSQWEACPTQRVLTIEALSDVPRHELRPDIYPAETP